MTDELHARRLLVAARLSIFNVLTVGAIDASRAGAGVAVVGALPLARADAAVEARRGGARVGDRILVGITLGAAPALVARAVVPE